MSKTVKLYSKVKVKSAKTPKTFMIEIVNPNEINLAEGKISAKSPLGQALFGHFVNEEVTVAIPSGNVSYKIIEIK